MTETDGTEVDARDELADDAEPPATDRAVVNGAVVDDAGDPPPVSRRPSGGSGLPLSIAIAVVVVVLDQLSKRWALHALAQHTRHVVWTLQFNLTFNSGMAFSRGQGVGPYIGVLAFVVVVGLLLSLRRSGRGVSTVAVGLVVGGALGNLTDRAFRGDGWLRGHVIDFIDLKWWPIFNVADMGVTIGGALLVLTAAFDSSRRR